MGGLRYLFAHKFTKMYSAARPYPDPLRNLQTLNSLVGFKGLLLKDRKGRESKERDGTGREERGAEGER